MDVDAGALQAEIREFQGQLESVRRYAEQVDAIAEQRLSRVNALELALRDLLDGYLGECFLNHNGFCEEHNSGEPCIVATARKVLEAT